jgi:hypothetical protein
MATRTVDRILRGSQGLAPQDDATLAPRKKEGPHEAGLRISN